MAAEGPQTPSPTPTPTPPPRHQGLLVSRRAIGIIITVVVVGLGAVGASAFLGQRAANQPRPTPKQASNSASPQPAADKNDAFAQQYLQGCKDRSVTFAHAPVPLGQLGYVDPLGKVSDGHVTPTDHVYLAPTNQQAADNTTDVVMPADGTITQVGVMPAQYIGDKNQTLAPEDHRVIIAHNCRYVSIFIHVHQLAPAVQAALGGKLKPNEQKMLSLELKAGDLIGKIGGNPVDWTLADAQTKLTGYITPSLYDSEPWKVHTIDPFSVYSGSLKTNFSAKSLRTIEPLAGKIDYDKKGFMVGNWFREGTNGYAGASQDRYYDGHLSIAPGNIDPRSTIFSIGNWAGKTGQYAMQPDLDPATIGPASGPNAYELTDISYLLPNGQPWFGGAAVKGMTMAHNGKVVGTVLIQVLPGEKLKLETFPGKTAAQVKSFTSAARTYVR